MPTTFKPVVYADNKRQDGTYNVKIRVTHRRQTLKLSTNMYVAAHQMTRALKLKDQSIIDEAKRIIDNWRAIVGRLGAAADVMTVRQVVDYIKQTEQNNMAFELDFIAYGRKKAETMRPGTGIGYQIALNALVRYIGTETLDISRINARFLTGFEQFIEAEPVLTHSRKGAIRQLHKTKKGGRAISSYLACVRHIHNLAKQEFNDEELGVIRIPQSPFKTYKVKQPPKVKKRAVSPDILQQIINLGDEPRRAGSISDFTRRDLARDCFLLSFGLAGMNAADLLSCPAQPLDGDVIIYNRQKTASRREDEAEMHIRIEPQIAPLVEKYGKAVVPVPFALQHGKHVQLRAESRFEANRRGPAGDPRRRPTSERRHRRRSPPAGTYHILCRPAQLGNDSPFGRAQNRQIHRTRGTEPRRRRYENNRPIYRPRLVGHLAGKCKSTWPARLVGTQKKRRKSEIIGGNFA